MNLQLTLTSLLFFTSAIAETFDSNPKFPCQPPHYSSYPFCNASLSTTKRALSLVSLLTPPEKITQLSNTAASVPRLGIPPYEWWSEFLHGLADNGPGVSFNGSIASATSFPQVIVSAASFNRTLWREIGSAVAVEGRAMFVELYPKGMIVEDHYVSLFLFANPETLRLGWKRRASFSFILLNQSGKELGRRRPEFCERLFCAYCTGWGRSKELPLKKLKEKGSLENSKLIVKVEIQVHEVVDEGGITGKEMVDVWGFRVLCSQAIPVSRLFQTHRDIAANFRQKSELVKTAYMNHLLGLIETLNKPPNSFTDAELSNARIELIDLTQAGFKTKLNEIFLERKKANAHVQKTVDEHSKVELVNMEEMVTSQGWLVRSWNEWKVRLGYAHHVRYEQLNLKTPFL
ncbi:unnamed protein product [Brassica napus]|uniref:(rape) hypothetical protein n=1 Tax=Brassica napus TaxID=3708 RepID=A0A816JJ87_BRANA|nr:unnamed protein product [Brassica napus]